MFTFFFKKKKALEKIQSVVLDKMGMESWNSFTIIVEFLSQKLSAYLWNRITAYFWINMETRNAVFVYKVC